MRFEDSVKSYLEGKNFSSGLYVKISHVEKNIPDRIRVLENIVYDKNIIHLGCVDHLPLVEDKIKRGVWLHERLCRSARKCLGVDIDEHGVKYVKETLGYSDVLCANIQSEILEIKEGHWDYIVMGEILEHVNNPVSFMQEIKKMYGDCIDKIIVTVPNAFALGNSLCALRHREFINSDHRFWFTPYTLGMVVCQGGMQVESFLFCGETVQKTRNPLRKLTAMLSVHRSILKLFPALRESIVMIVKV